MIEAVARGTTQFYISFKDVDWRALIRGSEKSLDIVVYYWDNWTAEYFEELTHFLRKPGTCIRFFFTDITDPILAQQVLAFFPRNTSAVQLQQRIIATYVPLQQFCKEQGLDHNKVMVYAVPHMLGYALQKVDDKLAIVSIFEMYRALKQLNAPAFVIDLQQDTDMRLFCEKELSGMMRYPAQ